MAPMMRPWWRLRALWFACRFWVEDNAPIVRREVALFFRIAWLRLRRKTGYRYTFRPGFQPDGSLIQRNGLRLPNPTMRRHFDDVRADMLAAWNAIEAKDEAIK